MGGKYGVLQGEQLVPVFHARVWQPEQGPRRFCLADTPEGPSLATCAPRTPQRSNTEVEILASDGTAWGAILRKDSNTHQVFQGKKLTLTLKADRDESLQVTSDADGVLAVATHCPKSQLLELGVKGGVDPVLVLLCILGIATFPLEKVMLPEPVL